MKRAIIILLLFAVTAVADNTWYSSGGVWYRNGGDTYLRAGAAVTYIPEFEWLFASAGATDTSGNSNDGTVIGMTYTEATNGLSAYYDMANATNSISATLSDAVEAVAFWANTNDTWRYYEYIAGTTRVNNASESYPTNEFFTVSGSTFSFIGSTHDIAQARGYVDPYGLDTSTSNRTELGGNLGIISDYLADNTNTYWQDTELYVGFNNIIQDGSPNGYATDSASSPTLSGTTGIGWGGFNGLANYVDCTDIEMNGWTNLTISLWMRAGQSAPSSQRLISKDQVGVQGAFNLWADSSGDLTWQVHDGTAFREASWVAYPGGTNWHHVVAVLRGTDIELYYDGDLEASASTMTSGIDDADNENVAIGSDSDIASPEHFWNGDISDVTIMSNAWSLATVTNYFDDTKGNYPGF